MTEPLQVLFVCTANICRSAYAERRAGMLVPPGRAVRISSAGTYGLAAQEMSEEMGQVLQERGGDPTGHRSRRVRLADLQAADVVLTMETAHRLHLIDDFPGMAPKVFTITQFAGALDTVDPTLVGADLVAAVFRARPVPGPDVSDPYRRGRAANLACADLLDGLLERIVPRLALPIADGPTASTNPPAGGDR